MTAQRSEFSTKTKLEAMMRYARCPGVFELGIKCGKRLGTLSATQFDHIMRCEIKPDKSPENCRPLCLDCHSAKTTKKDTVEAKKGRNIRGENKPKVSRPIRSAGFPSKEQRQRAKDKFDSSNRLS